MSKHNTVAEDLLRLRLLGDPRLTPDGTSVAWVEARTVANDDADAAWADSHVYRANLWLSPFTGGAPRQLTFGGGRNHSPRWSPDSRTLAFVSNRSGRSQLWLIDADGGEARPLTTLASGASGPVWSPDGRRIAFVSRTAAGERTDESGASDVRVIDRLRYKADGASTPGLLDDRRSHVWVVDVATGATVQLTDGDWDDESPLWTPDGQAIVFASYRGPDPDFTFERDLWLVPADGGAARLLVEHVGPLGAAAFSPDGQQLAYLGHDNHLGGATNYGLWLAPAAGGSGQLLTSDCFYSIAERVTGDARPITGVGSGGPVWAADGQSIYSLLSARGTTLLHRFPVDGGPSTCLLGNEGRLIDAFSFDATGQRCAYLGESPTEPTEIFVWDAAGGERQLSRANDEFTATVKLVAPESITFPSDDGWEVQGWLMPPTEHSPGERYPLVLAIHGGPHANYGWAFFHEFQLLAAQGWGVLFCNPRGSGSYGESFAAACLGDWGGGDYRDLMKGVDHVIATAPWVDPDRLLVTGGSFGGFMTNWIVTQTGRFRAAASQRSFSNRYSFFGTSDMGWWYGEREFGGTPWADEERLMARSPIRHVRNITTPLLLLHSERDYCCPIEQAEQLFVALKCLGRETQLVRFPDEDHDLSRTGRPAHRIERLQRIVDWLKGHVG